MRGLGIFLLCLALTLGRSGMVPAAAAAPENLEELRYRLSLGFWEDVARVQLRFTRVGPDRYRAQFSGAAQGAWNLLRRWLPESYESDMALEAGRLKPLLYREKFYSKGQHVSKEFRFDYSKKVIEVWRGVDGRPPKKEWQGPLPGPVYDPLTLFYSLRLGTVGPVTPGQTLRVPLIPNPEPREMIMRIGPESPQGRKVMLTLRTGGGEEEGPYFLFSDTRKVPLLAWVRVPVFGKLAGQLLNPEEIMKEVIPSPVLPGPGGEKH